MSSPAEKSEIKLPTSIQPIAPVEFKLCRQELRRMGRKAIEAAIRHQIPNAPRRIIRQYAAKCQKEAWQERDEQAVKKLKVGVTPIDPNYWKGLSPHLNA